VTLPIPKPMNKKLTINAMQLMLAIAEGKLIDTEITESGSLLLEAAVRLIYHAYGLEDDLMRAINNEH